MKNLEKIKLDTIDLKSMKFVDLNELAKKMQISNFINLISNNIETKETLLNNTKKIKKKVEHNSSQLIRSLAGKISEQNWFSKRSEIDKIIIKIEKKYVKELGLKKESIEKDNLESVSKEKKEFYNLINEYKKKKKKYFSELDENKRKNSEIKKI